MVLFLLYCSFHLSGQEALRVSQASAQAAEARRQAATTFNYYNLKIGPTGWHFSTALSLQGTDNVQLTDSKADGDIIIAPQLNTQMQWPVTELNSLNLNIGVGYSAYVDHSKLSRVYVLPGTALSFDVYVGDLWINLHDMVSVTQNAYQDPTVAGTGDYAQLANTIGVSATWDWSKGTIKVGYDHANYIGLSSGANRNPSSGSELFSLSAGYAFKPEKQVGLEVSGGLTHFSPTSVTATVVSNNVTTNIIQIQLSPAHDASQWSVGAFLDSPISDYIHFRGSAGYTVYDTSLPGSTNQTSGLYAQISLTHRLNQYVTYSLGGGRSVSFAFYGGAVEMYSASWQANWSVLEKVAIATTFSFEHGTQLGAAAEVFDRWGAGLTLGRPLTKKLSGGLAYQFYKRDSDQAGKDYTVNSLSLSFSYVF